MPWFKSDDSFYRHPKVRRLGKDKLPAVGLWQLAGTWCADNLDTNTCDGFIPAEQIALWDPRHRYARRLVAVGLWSEIDVDGEHGFRFHDWADYQPTKASVEAEREAWREKKAAQRKGKSPRVSPGDNRVDSPEDNSHGMVSLRQHRSLPAQNRTPVLDTVEHATTTHEHAPHEENPRSTTTEEQLSPRDTPGSPPPSPPIPVPVPVPVPSSGHLRRGDARNETSHQPPPPKPPEHCPQHPGGTPEPCGPCADARRSTHTWDQAETHRRNQLRAELDAARHNPDLRCHHGTDAGHYRRPDTGTSPCALCRQETHTKSA
ncbi:hypothetical protein CFN78_06915 [Amycolatopsis antarctica]|uniref:Uncharacterized protein n=1 Tax=Amycolatopsis antarctica TaxID=1854586 RepID=A0A263D676_9PSEU|nr:hypothetical protein CFN78_06915 [Amycolatopsis antarctica]